MFKQECRPFREEISALRRGEEPAMEPADLDAHLESCGECRQAREQGQQLFSLLEECQPRPLPGGGERLRLAISTGKYRSGSVAASSGRRGLSLPAVILAAAAALLLAFWLGGTFSGKKSEPVAQHREVAVITGARGLKTSDGRDLGPGAAMESGTRLRLAGGGRARLVMHRGAVIDVAGGSSFRLDAGDRLHLESGRVLAVVRKGASPFKVTTANACVETLGTRFTVDARGPRSAVAVSEGRVKFSHTGPGNGSVEVAAHQKSVVAGSTPPSAPVPASVSDLAWTVSVPRRELELSIELISGTKLPGERVLARLTLRNRSESRVRVDGTGRGRSNYFVRVTDPAGRSSHFAPPVLEARVDGTRSTSPLIELKPGSVYELKLDLGAFAHQPGSYSVSALYLESAASASTEWSGALQSGVVRMVVSRPLEDKQDGTE